MKRKYVRIRYVENVFLGDKYSYVKMRFVSLEIKYVELRRPTYDANNA